MKPERAEEKVSAFDKVLNGTVWIAGTICAFIMFIVVWEVLARKIFGRPTSWVLDVGTLGLLIAALAPIAWVLKMNAHVNISLVSDKLSARTRSAVNLVTYSFALLACCVMVYEGIQVWLTAYQENETLFRSLVIPKVWYIWIFPFSFFLLIVQALKKVVEFYREFKRSEQ